MSDGPLRMMWLRVFARLMESDGYLVVGSRAGYQVGDRTQEQYDIGVPFLVIGEATWEDAVKQRDLIAEVAGMRLPLPPTDVKFYKARAVSV